MKIPTITAGSTLPRNESASTSSVNKPSREPDTFQQGRLLKAKVLAGNTPGGKVLLDVAGRELSARSLVQLAAGDQIWLEVSRGGREPLLSLASQKGAIQDFLQSMFINPQRADSLLDRLLPFLAGHALDGNSTTATPLAGILAGMASSGQGSKPDPTALKIMAFLYGGFHPGQKEDWQKHFVQQLENLLKWKNLSPSLRKMLNEALDFLDKHQQINTSSPGREDPSIFLFPCFFKEEAGWGEWMFSRSGKGEAGQSSYELNFFLDMSKLGPLSLHVTCDSQNLNGQFHLADQKAVDFMKTKTAELEDILCALGYETVSFGCLLSRKNLQLELKDALLQRASLDSFSLIDVTA